MPSAAEAVDLARQISARDVYQRDLAEPESKSDQNVKWNTDAARLRLRGAAPVGPVGASLVHLIFYLMMGLALGLALVWTLSAWRARERESKGKAVEPVPGRPGDLPEPELEKILELAGSGRYGEAVHELMLLAIVQLLRRQARRLEARRTPWPDESLTGRELVQVLPQDAGERQRFAHLVATVERVLFAGQPLDAEAFAACLESYRGLAG